MTRLSPLALCAFIDAVYYPNGKIICLEAPGGEGIRFAGAANNEPNHIVAEERLHTVSSNDSATITIQEGPDQALEAIAYQGICTESPINFL